jgi:hypothetical protein
MLPLRRHRPTPPRRRHLAREGLKSGHRPFSDRSYPGIGGDPLPQHPEAQPYLGEPGHSASDVSRWTGLHYGAMLATAFPPATPERPVFAQADPARRAM